MPLFTDRTIVTIDELRGYETGILNVAHTEGIDLATKLALAHEEVEVELTALLNEGATGAAQAGVMTKPGINNVVTTDPLRQWHIFQTLSLVYRDAYNNQLNDRYQGKWKEYNRLANRASSILFKTGLGIVDDPILEAQPPTLRTIPGPLPAATYYARVAWRNGKGEEGRPSAASVISAPDGSLLVVEPVNQPPNARTWNVYAGLSDKDSTLQNDSPLEVGGGWTEPASGLTKGKEAGDGQTPNYYHIVGRVLRRG